jgi:hypothetical protein
MSSLDELPGPGPGLPVSKPELEENPNKENDEDLDYIKNSNIDCIHNFVHIYHMFGDNIMDVEQTINGCILSLRTGIIQVDDRPTQKMIRKLFMDHMNESLRKKYYNCRLKLIKLTTDDTYMSLISKYDENITTPVINIKYKNK